MAFVDRLPAHAAAASRHFGETLTFWPKAGGSFSVMAVVDRTGEEPAEQFATNVERVRVQLVKTALLTAVADGDQIDIPFKFGAAPARGRIDRIVEQDEGGWLVEVIR